MASDLESRRILITSGPTRANLDAVRFLSNRSTGRLGCAIAEQALDRSAEVTFVAGPESRVPQDRDGLHVVHIETVEDLLEALQTQLTATPHHAVIHAMAVLDYVPAETEHGKVRSGRDEWTLRLVRTPKVIGKLKEWAPNALLTGFKLEVDVDEDELIAAGAKLATSNGAEMVVANDLGRIRDEVHPALVVNPEGNILARPETKPEIARMLCYLLA